MHISFHSTDTDHAIWLQDFQAALPTVQISTWQPGAAPVSCAIVRNPTQQFFDEQPQLATMFNLAAGVDSLFKRQFRSSVNVVRLEDSGMAVQMAEYVCHAVIGHFRGLGQYQSDARQGLWQPRAPKDRSQCVVGIMGLGVLGQRVAKALHGFEFPLRGWSRSAKQIQGVACFAGDAQLGDFLQGVQVLVCLLPLTDATRGLLNRHTLSQLKPGAYLVNVARGAQLVEDDLIALIDQGHLSGATLDVFDTEPLPAAHPFWSRPHISITPHISAITLRAESVAQIASKIHALARNEPITGIVNNQMHY
jgi:glyoxylate/hydroxypyruvate reductase